MASKEERFVDGFSEVMKKDRELDRQLKLWELYIKYCEKNMTFEDYLAMFRSFCEAL